MRLINKIKILMNENNNIDFAIPGKFEILMLKDEKKKRLKKKLIWKNYKELVDEKKLVYNNKEKRIIRELLYNPIPPNFRLQYWLIISGSKQEIINNPGYYDKLKKLVKISPNFPYTKSISLDAHRTFPSMDFFKDEKNLEKLSNILSCFALRNSISIGYCKGLNFVVAQILLITQDEEQVFWIFTKIVEDFLPFDFYLKFSGVRIDTEIVYSFLVKKLDFIDKNEELKLCIDNLITRCLISLYSETVGVDILRNIWDLFFAYGDIILFRTFKFIAYLLCERKFERYSIQEIHKELINKLSKIDDIELLNFFLLCDNLINELYVKESRKRKKNQVKKNINFKKDISIDRKMKCDLRTPYCVYNTEINDINKYNEIKIFRMKKNTKYYENYFKDIFENDNEYDDEETGKINNNNNYEINTINNNVEDNKNKIDVTLDTFDDLLIERHKHVCTKEQQAKY